MKRKTAKELRIAYDKKIAYDKAYRLKNLDHYKELNRRNREANLEAIKEKQHLYYAKNREHLKAYARNYHKNLMDSYKIVQKQKQMAKKSKKSKV